MPRATSNIKGKSIYEFPFGIYLANFSQKQASSNMGDEEENPNSIDLLVEIFIRLPTKSILKCRTVSKDWRSILESMRFAERRIKKIPYYLRMGLKKSPLIFILFIKSPFNTMSCLLFLFLKLSRRAQTEFEFVEQAPKEA